MKSYIHKLCAGLFVLATLGACSSTKTAGVSLSPKPGDVIADPSGQATVKVNFRIPADYLSKRGRLLITPRLVTSAGEVVALYDPVAVDAPVYTKKMYRRAVLEGYVDSIPGQVIPVNRWTKQVVVPYETQISVPQGTKDAYIDALVSVEGCTSCGNVDTLYVAALQQAAPADTFSLRWMRPALPREPKRMEGQGVAALQFVINRSDIDLSMGNNRSELEEMEKRLLPVLKDSLATLQNIHIIGRASADGPFAFNTNLAYRRAVSAKQWLLGQLAVTPDDAARIYADVHPEGWEPVLTAMRMANDPDADAVAAVLARCPAGADNDDDRQEREIRKLPCWERIRTNYLQKDRKVEYRYAYTLKSFTTDEELLRMYADRPDTFSEEEFYRVAELMPSVEQKIAVYRKWLAYYPDSEIGKNNLAVLTHERLSAGDRKGEAK